MAFLFKKQIIFAVLAALLSAGGYWGGYSRASNACKAEKLAAVERAVEQTRKIEEENRAIAEDFLETENRVRVEYRTIYKEIEKHVPTTVASDTDCRLDDVGMRLLADALRGPSAKDSAGASQRVPGSSSAKRP